MPGTGRCRPLGGGTGMSQDLPDGPQALQVLAGEYVLGVLDAAEMRAVRQRSVDDPALAAAITTWEAQLAPLAATLPETAPPPALWARIERDIAAAAPAPTPILMPRRIGLRAPPGRLGSALPPPRAAAAVSVRRVWPWQAATGFSLALAASLGAFLVLPHNAAPLRLAVLMPSAVQSDNTLSELLPNGAQAASSSSYDDT